MANIENVIHQTIGIDGRTEVFPEDSVSNFMLLQNVSDTDMFLNFGGDAVIDEGIKLAAGTNFLLDNVTIDAALSAIHGSTGSKILLVTRG